MTAGGWGALWLGCAVLLLQADTLWCDALSLGGLICLPAVLGSPSQILCVHLRRPVPHPEMGMSLAEGVSAIFQNGLLNRHRRFLMAVAWRHKAESSYLIPPAFRPCLCRRRRPSCCQNFAATMLSCGCMNTGELLSWCPWSPHGKKFRCPATTSGYVLFEFTYLHVGNGS